MILQKYHIISLVAITFVLALASCSSENSNSDTNNSTTSTKPTKDPNGLYTGGNGYLNAQIIISGDTWSGSVTYFDETKYYSDQIFTGDQLGYQESPYVRAIVLGTYNERSGEISFRYANQRITLTK